MNLQIEKLLRACIHGIPGIGSQRLRQIIALYGSAQAAWNAAAAHVELEKTSWLKDFLKTKERISPDQVERLLNQEGISLVILGEENYPSLLAECSDAPPILYYKGFLEPLREGLAVVGARRATPYGKAAAAHLAREIVELGYVVVSGLARGIDSAAHQGALGAGGNTWAIMAGGLDYIYPPENKKLAHSIMENGALISEYPPGMPTESGQFPARNRLISGTSRGVVVVEAAQRSGSLITADFALEQGREVFAVPGPIFSEYSKGTHQLLRMGAKLVEGKEDILQEISWNHRTDSKERVNSSKTSREDKHISSVQEENWEEILNCLCDIPLHIDRLTTLCLLPAHEIALGLLELQLAGRIIQMPGQHYVLQR